MCDNVYYLTNRIVEIEIVEEGTGDVLSTITDCSFKNENEARDWAFNNIWLNDGVEYRFKKAKGFQKSIEP